MLLSWSIVLYICALVQPHPNSGILHLTRYFWQDGLTWFKLSKSSFPFLFDTQDVVTSCLVSNTHTLLYLWQPVNHEQLCDKHDFPKNTKVKELNRPANSPHLCDKNNFPKNTKMKKLNQPANSPVM